MGLYRVLVVVAALSGTTAALPQPAAAEDADFPVIEDPLLVPVGWSSRRNAKGSRFDDDIQVMQDQVLEPWDSDAEPPKRAARSRRKRSDWGSHDSDRCECHCSELLIPPGWAR
ncbi:MAG: hypothetical protein OEZ06_23155 [Myxococcales bacterium]|nr:hypothetical protein [Myxococcales bacterium]